MSEPAEAAAKPPPSILDRLKTIISEVSGVPVVEIHLDSTLREDLELDTLAFLELSLEIEDEWNLEVTEDQHEHLQSVQDVLTLIEKAAA